MAYHMEKNPGEKSILTQTLFAAVDSNYLCSFVIAAISVIDVWTDRIAVVAFDWQPAVDWGPIRRHGSV